MNLTTLNDIKEKVEYIGKDIDEGNYEIKLKNDDTNIYLIKQIIRILQSLVIIIQTPYSLLSVKL